MADFHLAAEPEQFRSDLCAWLEAQAPRSLWETVTTPFQGHWGGRNSGFETADHQDWFERCLALGWTAPAWPKEYGGAAMGPAHHRIFVEELRARGLPLPLVGFGLTMIGPILLAAGNEAQKAEHLPKIVRGDIRWCQGYSEPNAGSDLANLRTRAERDGDDFIVSHPGAMASGQVAAAWRDKKHVATAEQCLRSNTALTWLA